MSAILGSSYKKNPPRGRAHVYGGDFGEPAIDDSSARSELEIARLQARHSELLMKIFALEGKQTKFDVVKYLPRGLHQIRPHHDTPDPLGDRLLEIVIDEQTAVEMEAQRVSIIASGHLPYFSVSHDSQTPAFWPSQFYWEGDLAKGGVYARGNWTTHGRAFLERGRATFFSPVVAYDRRTRPHRIGCHGWDLGPNMGAFIAGGAAFGEKLRVSFSQVAQDAWGRSKARK